MAVFASNRFQPEPVIGFDHEKSVQIIGYFLSAAGKPMDKMKLIKLIYLADRLSFQRRGKPLNFDEFYSLPHGPIASSALNGMNGLLRDKAWHRLALASDNKTVLAAVHIPQDHISKADASILKEVWDEFGGMTAAQLRAWTHKNCPEYEELETTSRSPILIEDILDAVGLADSDKRARELRALQRSRGKLARAGGA